MDTSMSDVDTNIITAPAAAGCKIDLHSFDSTMRHTITPASATSTSSVNIGLRCSLCNQSYTRPHVLSCLHTFCYECVAKSDPKFVEGCRIYCPECQQESAMSDGTIRPNYVFANTLAAEPQELGDENGASLQCGNCAKDIKCAVFCQECDECLCEACVYFHQNTKLTRNHTIKQMPKQMDGCNLASNSHARRVNCCIHTQNAVERYCVMCEELVCNRCNDTHSKHKMIGLDEAYSLETPVLREVLEKASRRMDSHEKCASRCCVTVDELRTCKRELSENIASYFAAYKENLDRCEKQLLGMVLSWYDKNFETLKQVQNDEEQIAKKLSDALKLTHVALKHCTGVEILSMKSLIQSQVNRVTSHCCAEPLVDAVQEAVRNARWDSTQQNVPVLSPKGLWLPEAKRNQATRIQADIDSLSDYEMIGNEDNIVSERGGATGRARKTSGKDGEDYHIGGIITPGGRSNLWSRFRSVMVREGRRQQDQTGRDYRYDKILRNRTVGRQGKDFGEFCHPCDIAVDGQRHDRLIVTDYSNDRVQVFNHFGDFLFSFGKRGSKLGQFMGPTGVAVLHNGSIVVADSLNNRVQLFTSSGRYFASFGEEGRDLSQLWRPMGVAVDSRNRIVVVDQGNNRLQVFDHNGDFCFAFAELGHWDGMVSCPNFVAIDNDDNIYVSDEVETRIQIFDPHGNYLRKITAQEIHGFHDNHDTFSGIAVDKRGYVIVGGKGKCCVQVFTPDGRFLRQFTSKCTSRSRLQFASGIALTSAGEIVVSDWMNNRIRFF